MTGSDLSSCQDTVSPEPHPWTCFWLCATHCEQPVPECLRAAVLSHVSLESSQKSPHADAGSMFLCPFWDQLSGKVTACGERLPALSSICCAEQELEDAALEWQKSLVQKQWFSVNCCFAQKEHVGMASTRMGSAEREPKNKE